MRKKVNYASQFVASGSQGGRAPRRRGTADGDSDYEGGSASEDEDFQVGAGTQGEGGGVRVWLRQRG